MQITTAWLRKQGACAGGIAEFKSKFGKSAKLTRANLHKMPHHARWLAGRLLDAEAWAEYERVLSEARAEYRRMRAEALAESERTCDEYERVRPEMLEEEYERVRRTAWDKYIRANVDAVADAIGLA